MSQSDDRHFLRGYCTRRRNQSCPVQQIRDMVCVSKTINRLTLLLTIVEAVVLFSIMWYSLLHSFI